MSELRNIRIVDIEPNPNNPRKHFDPEALDQLAASIREVGVLQPLVVVPLPVEAGQFDRYRIICGERRWRAAQLADVGFVPAIVETNLQEAQIAQIMLIENIQRQDLDPIEEARALQALIADHGWKQVDLAERLGVSQPHIANRIRLLKLPESVQQNISAGILPSSAGKELVSYADRIDLGKLAEDAKKNSWTATQIIDRAKSRAWEKTRPLQKDQGWPQPEFNLGTCEGCKDRIDMARPWDTDNKKVPRCGKPECWLQKQKAVQESRDDVRRQKAVDALKNRGQEVSEVLDMSGRVHGSYETFSHHCSFDREDCDGCEYRAWGMWSYTSEAVEVCFHPECFREKQHAVVEARKKEKTALKESFEARKLEIVNSAMEWDQPLLHFLAAQLLMSDLGAECDIFEHLEQRFSWELPEDTYDDASIERLVELLQSLPAEELRRIILYVLVMSIRDDDPLWRDFFANWQPPAPAETEPEPICTGPIGKVWRDNKDREIFVSTFAGHQSYGTFYQNSSGGLHRVDYSTRMPMVASAAIAQENLDKWAQENKLEEVAANG